MGETLPKIAFALLGGAVIGILSALAFGSDSIWPVIIGVAGALGLVWIAFKGA